MTPSRYIPPPTPRARVYRLAMASNLDVFAVRRVLEWSHDGPPHERAVMCAAAARCAIELPSREDARPAPPPPAAEQPRPPRATDLVPRAPTSPRRGRRGSGSLARAAARRELHANRDAAPPRDGQGAA